MLKSESIDALSAALALAQGKIKGAKKDTDNPFFKRSYADLASAWEACREPLSSNGLAVTQTTTIMDVGGTLHQVLVTTLTHKSGQWISGEYLLEPIKDDPQAKGSAMTYARRYTLMAILGIAPEDDDGEAAMKRKPPVSVGATPPVKGVVNNRDKLNASLIKLYRPFRLKFPDVELPAILMQKYGVDESTKLSLDQLSDLVSYMEHQLGEKVPGSKKVADQVSRDPLAPLEPWEVELQKQEKGTVIK